MLLKHHIYVKMCFLCLSYTTSKKLATSISWFWAEKFHKYLGLGQLGLGWAHADISGSCRPMLIQVEECRTLNDWVRKVPQAGGPPFPDLQ